jgi:hypothetical protein
LENRARAALAEATAELRVVQGQVVAEDVEQRSILLTPDLNVVLVDHQPEELCHSDASECFRSGQRSRRERSLVVLHAAMRFHNIVEMKDRANLDMKRPGYDLLNELVKRGNDEIFRFALISREANGRRDDVHGAEIAEINAALTVDGQRSSIGSLRHVKFSEQSIQINARF